MPKNLHTGKAMAKDSAIPSITIKVPLPKNVKAPAKDAPKSTSR
jgi:hypothetical protein